MLTPERRKQLDGIVLDLSKKNAPQTDVQMIVDDFSKKYGSEKVMQTPTAMPVKTEDKPYGQLSVGEKAFSGRNEASENLRKSGHNIIAGALDVSMSQKNLNVGVAKGLLSTVEGAAKLGAKGFDMAKEKITGEESNTKVDLFPDYMTNAEGVAQGTGKVAEQIGEFFVPASLTAKLVKYADAGIGALKVAEASPFAAKALKLLSRSGILASEGAAVTAVQSGGDKEQIKFNAAISGGIPIVGATLKPIANTVLKPIGEKIQSSLIRPTLRDMKDGFNIENVTKYNLGGSLEDMAMNTNNRIVELSNKLKSAIGASSQRVDAQSLINAAESEITTNGSKTFGINTKIGKAFEHWKEELGAITQNGTVDLADAQNMKRSLGKMGAWSFGARDAESTAMETVANTLYSKFKVAIEEAAGPEVQAINRQLSELIPIENAIIRRIPVAERNNIISLSDIVTAVPALVHPANAWLYVLNKMSKSGRFAKTLIGSAKEGGPRGDIKTTILGPKIEKEIEQIFTPPKVEPLGLPAPSYIPMGNGEPFKLYSQEEATKILGKSAQQADSLSPDKLIEIIKNDKISPQSKSVIYSYLKGKFPEVVSESEKILGEGIEGILNKKALPAPNGTMTPWTKGSVGPNYNIDGVTNRGSAQVKTLIGGGTAIAGGVGAEKFLTSKRTIEINNEPQPEVKGASIEKKEPLNLKVGKTPDEKFKVIATIVAEAIGEGEEGMQASLNTVMNRANEKQKSLYDVVSDKAQYSAFSNDNDIFVKVRDMLRGKPVLFKDATEKQLIENATKKVQKMIDDPNLKDVTDGATHYFNPRTMTDKSWMNGGVETKRLGRHVFKKGIAYR